MSKLYAERNTGLNGEGNPVALRVDSNNALLVALNGSSGGAVSVELANPPASWDEAFDKTVVEHRYQYRNVTTSSQIKASSGLVHTICIEPTTATPTAGLAILYDNTAGSGTIIWQKWLTATDSGVLRILDITFDTALFLTLPANFNGTVTYR
jgi:hypothetical protein